MIEGNNLDYYSLREVQERHAAMAATCIEARAAHNELADRYADQCWSFGEGFAMHIARSNDQ